MPVIVIAVCSDRPNGRVRIGTLPGTPFPGGPMNEEPHVAPAAGADPTSQALGTAVLAAARRYRIACA